MAYALNPITLRPQEEEPTVRMMASGVPAQGFLGPQATPSGETATALMETVTEPILNQGAPTNIPLLVPGQVNLEHLLSGNPPTPDQFEIAMKHALGRVQAGERIQSYANIDEAVQAAKGESDARGVALQARQGQGLVQGVPSNFFDDIAQAKAPVIERSLPGEALAGFARGAGPTALGTIGQAMRGVGLEEAGTAVKGYGESLQQAAPSIFRPSTAAQVPGSFRNILSSATESIAQSAVISAPAVLASIATGGGAVPIAMAYILSTPGVFGAAEYQNFFDEGRKAGYSDAELRAPAVLSALSEVGFEAAGNVMDTMLMGRGISRYAAGSMKSKLRQGIKAVLTPKLPQTALDIGASAAAEGGTEYLTAVAQNKLRQDMGIPGQDDPFSAGAAGGLAGAIFGIVGKGIMRGVHRSQLNTLASATAEPNARLQQVNQVIAQMHEGHVDEELITHFSNYAADAIAQGQPIPLGQDIAGLGVQPEAPLGPEEGPPAPMQGPPSPVQGPPAPMPQQPGLFEQPPSELPTEAPETIAPTPQAEVAPPVPIVQPGATQEVQPAPTVEAPPVIEPPAPLVQPRGPQVSSGTTARLLSPVPALPQVTPEEGPAQTVQPRAPQMPATRQEAPSPAEIPQTYAQAQSYLKTTSDPVLLGMAERILVEHERLPFMTREEQRERLENLAGYDIATAVHLEIKRRLGIGVMQGGYSFTDFERHRATLETQSRTGPINVTPPRAPQLPPGTTSRQAIQPVQPTAVSPPGDVGAETPVPPVSEAPLATPPAPAPTPPAAPDLLARAVEKFGVTTDPANALYLLPDGRYLDKSQGPRIFNHDDISSVMPTTARTADERIAQFGQTTGAVRILEQGPNDLSVQAFQPLTPGQRTAILKASQDYTALTVEIAGTAQTFELPGQRRELRAFLQEPAPAPPAAPTPQTPPPIATPRGGSYPFTYEWVPAAETIPSHHPQSFSPNQRYEEVSGMPVGATQDRAYHREPAEQAKVVDQDRQFPERYGFMLSTSPDATHGPPVMPADSNVTIAGNSRLMTILRKIQEPGQPGYQNYLRDATAIATQQGIGPAPEGMQSPILMRRLTDVSTNDREAMQRASREFNEPWTQALSEKAQAVASGKALSAETVAYLGEQLDALGEESTLRDFFRTAASRELIRRLQADGVLTPRTINKYVDDQGMLNEDGKTLVERAILGRVLPDSDLIDAAPASTINPIIKSLPALTQLQARGDLWDITQHLPEAVKLATDTKLNGWNTVEQYLKQGGLFGEQERNAVAIAMAEQLLSAKPTQTKRAFDRMAQAANRDVAGQGGFDFAPKQPPWDAFNAAFGATLRAQDYQAAVTPEGAPTPPPEQFQARPQTHAQGGGEPWTLTRQEVDASFPSPGYRVLELPEGGYRISTQAGYVDLLQVDQIQMGDQQRIAFQMGYGTPYSDDLSVNARFIHENGQSRIELVKGKADRVSLLHDVEHWIEHSGQLTPEQIQQLSEATGKGDAATAEDRAEYVARRLNDRRYRRDTPLGRMLDQIWDYLDRLLALVGIHTTRGIIRGIETGQGLARPGALTASSAQTTQQFQATPRPTPEQAPTENKLFTEYQSFLNITDPVVQDLFDRNATSYTKQIVTMAQVDRERDAVLEYWREHPKDFTRVINQWLTRQQLPTRAEIAAIQVQGQAFAFVLAHGVTEKTFTDAEFVAQRDTYVGPNTVFNLNTGFSSEAGRILRMFQDTPEQRLNRILLEKQKRLDRLLTPEERAAYEAEFNKINMTGDIAAIDKFLGKVHAENPTLWDYLKEFWYGSVLSGIPTQIANPGGNTLWTTFSLGALKGMEAFLDPWVAKQQNRPQQYFWQEILPSLAGFGRGLVQKERWQALGPGLKTGEFQMPGIDGLSKFEHDMEMFTSTWQHATWQLDFPKFRQLGIDIGPVRRALKRSFGIEPGQPINLMRSLAPIVSLGSRVMMGMDLLGRAAAYDGLIAGFVERQIQQELRTGALTDAGVAERRTLLLQQGHDKDHPQSAPMRAAALTQSKEFTFTDPSSDLAKLVLQGRRLPVIGKPFHMLMPFVATADRLIYRALELVPGIGLAIHHDELTHWKTAGPAVTSILARQLAGVFISIAMLELFKNGLLTGDVPDDPGEREAFYRAGKQPRSFKVGDTYISYQRFEPLNLMLGVLPSIWDAMTRLKEKDPEASYTALAGISGAVVSKHIIDASYFTGLSGAITAINRPSADQTESTVGRLVDSWIPFSGARRFITRTIEAAQTGEGTLVRNPQTIFGYISGASLVSDVRSRFNVWGTPITTPGNWAAQFIPYRVSVATHDPVENELARFKIYPGPPSQQDAKGNKLSPGDYDFLVQQGGHRMKGKLDRLVAQPYYQQLNEELRKTYLQRAIRQGRAEAREELQARSRARGLVGGGG